jgi:hypothetical protein
VDEYYMIEATLATGAPKYLILRDMDGVMTLYDKWDDKVGALAMVEYLNRG